MRFFRDLLVGVALGTAMTFTYVGAYKMLSPVLSQMTHNQKVQCQDKPRLVPKYRKKRVSKQSKHNTATKSQQRKVQYNSKYFTKEQIEWSEGFPQDKREEALRRIDKDFETMVHRKVFSSPNMLHVRLMHLLPIVTGGLAGQVFVDIYTNRVFYMTHGAQNGKVRSPKGRLVTVDKLLDSNTLSMVTEYYKSKLYLISCHPEARKHLDDRVEESPFGAFGSIHAMMPNSYRRGSYVQVTLFYQKDTRE